MSWIFHGLTWTRIWILSFQKKASFFFCKNNWIHMDFQTSHQKPKLSLPLPEATHNYYSIISYFSALRISTFFFAEWPESRIKLQFPSFNCPWNFKLNWPRTLNLQLNKLYILLHPKFWLCYHINFPFQNKSLINHQTPHAQLTIRETFLKDQIEISNIQTYPIFLSW